MRTSSLCLLLSAAFLASCSRNNVGPTQYDFVKPQVPPALMQSCARAPQPLVKGQTMTDAMAATLIAEGFEAGADCRQKADGLQGILRPLL